MQLFAIICMETVTVYGHHLAINCKVVVNSAATIEKFLMLYVIEVYVTYEYMYVMILNTRGTLTYIG